VYSIQQYVIKFVSDLQQVGGFLRVLRFLYHLNRQPRYNWNIYILLKVALNNIKPIKTTSHLKLFNTKQQTFSRSISKLYLLM
jgi:hypothetical protein